MLLYIFTAISGIALVVGTMLGLSILSKRFQLPRKIFWRAGVMLLLIDIFYLAVVGNMTSIWPDIESLPLIAKAILFGVISGLIFELGRFMILDKVMKDIRSFPEGVFFGFGWSGVEAFFLGILMIVSIAGMHLLATTSDFATTFSSASPEEIDQLKSFQQQITVLLQGSPLIGFLPFFERMAQMLLDIALTFFVLLGFKQERSYYVWGAVALRTLFTMLLLIAVGLWGIWGELILIVIALLSSLWILKMRKIIKKDEEIV